MGELKQHMSDEREKLAYKQAVNVDNFVTFPRLILGFIINGGVQKIQMMLNVRIFNLPA